MKHTIKIDALRALVIEPVASQVTVTITTAGVRMFTQAVTPDQAQALSTALQLSAQHAQAGQAA